MLIPLSKRIKEILQHDEDNAMLPYLHVLEKHLLKLETIVATYQRTLFPISRQSARDKITQQVNLISSIFKALGRIEWLYPAWVDLAQTEVLQAYRATMDEGKEKTHLHGALEIKTWNQCIAIILSLNADTNRAHPFVENLKLFEACEAYVLPIEGPSRWTLIADELKQHAHELKQDLTIMGRRCTQIAMGIWDAAKTTTNNSFKFIEQQLAAWSQAISEKHAQWTAKPEESPFPEGYYKAPPISDQQLGALSTMFLWRSQAKINAIRGFNKVATSAKVGMDNFMNKGDNNGVFDGEPGTVKIPHENLEHGSEVNENFLNEEGTVSHRANITFK